MKNIKKTYTAFHEKNNSVHVYPTEWVIRTFLGKYPRLSLDQTQYANSKILDIGFGDGRNFPLLNNLSFNIYGIEITDKIVTLAKGRMERLSIPVVLKTGSNSEIPFEDNFFDYLLACFVNIPESAEYHHICQAFGKGPRSPELCFYDDFPCFVYTLGIGGQHLCPDPGPAF